MIDRLKSVFLILKQLILVSFIIVWMVIFGFVGLIIWLPVWVIGGTDVSEKWLIKICNIVDFAIVKLL